MAPRYDKGPRANVEPRQAKAHFLSVIGSETQISAIIAAIHMDEAFTLEAPGMTPIRAQLGRNAQCYRGSLQLTDRTRAVRHVIGVSEELATASASTGRTLLAHSDPNFVWAPLAHIHDLPGVPEWADWFHRQLSRHDSLVPLLGIGCQPVLVKGNREQFLGWPAREFALANYLFRSNLDRFNGPVSVLATYSEWPADSWKHSFACHLNCAGGLV